MVLPGTGDQRRDSALLGPFQDAPQHRRPPDPPNFHSHTRADLALCVSMRLTTPGAARLTLPKGIHQGESGGWNCAHTAAHSRWHLPSGDTLSTLHRASCGLMAAPSPRYTWLSRGLPHAHSSGMKAALPFSPFTHDLSLTCGYSPPDVGSTRYHTTRGHQSPLACWCTSSPLEMTPGSAPWLLALPSPTTPHPHTHVPGVLAPTLKLVWSMSSFHWLLGTPFSLPGPGFGAQIPNQDIYPTPAPHRVLFTRARG